MRLKTISIQELWFLRFARRQMLVNICMKFHEDNLNGFSYRADTILWLIDDPSKTKRVETWSGAWPQIDILCTLRTKLSVD